MDKDKILVSNEEFFSFVMERIERGELVKIRVKGRSMTPFLIGGRDDVVLRPVSDTSFCKGRLLLAKIDRGVYVLHRLESVNGREIVLRGDGNILAVERCQREQVIAEVDSVVRNGRRIDGNDLKWMVMAKLWPSDPFVRRLSLAVWHRLHYKTSKKYYKNK